MSIPITKHGVKHLDAGRKLPSKTDPRPKRFVPRCNHQYEEDRVDLRRKKITWRCIHCNESYIDSFYPGYVTDERTR